MTIYVDDMRRPARVGNLRGNWSHLFTDSDDQTALHEFAKALGLQRRWFQHEDKYPHAPWLWHYDVTDTIRTKAIAAGATPIAYPYETGRISHARSQAAKAVREDAPEII